VYPLLVHRDRAVPVARDMPRDTLHDHCNLCPRDMSDRMHRDAPFLQPPQHMLLDALAWRAPLPVCRSLGHHGQAGPQARGTRLAPRMLDKAHTRTKPAMRDKIRRSERPDKGLISF